MAARKFSHVLVANRGEIALRVMRSARAEGYRVTALYTEADARAPHVAFADAAVCIGEGPVADSYLNIKRIVDAARAAGADAIHPGYGFLSENAEFARAVTNAGLVFVGPQADAIALMGDKAAAKRRMQEAGVACVPGYEGEQQDDRTLLAAAKRLGAPLMVKAAAGGGGRGMRLVEELSALPAALARARAEALGAFGSDALILERAVRAPRHVEIQLMADTHGTIVHLGERDCSVQRRHQKLIEESPSPAVDKALRARMGEAAVQAARAIDYVGAGTVEFLLDADGAFYFLEMNTRLQVEHPVTEMVTGLDLVALQFKIAQGEPLGFAQDDVRWQGHAIEVRLYAEDPAQDFLPSTGPILRWQPPQGAGVRCDAGIAPEQEISPFYDSMLAKLIAHGGTREEARRRLVAALKSLHLFGPRHNRDFLLACLERPTFAQGKATTAFLADEFDGAFKAAPLLPQDVAAAAVLYYACEAEAMRARALWVPPGLHNFSTAGALATQYRLDFGDQQHTMLVRARALTDYEVVLGEATHGVQLQASADGCARLQLGETQRQAAWVWHDGVLHGSLTGEGAVSFRCRAVVGTSAEAQAGGDGRVLAPMHGRVAQIFVRVGQKVQAGERLAIVEAMKMQHEIAAPRAGAIAAVRVKPEQQVAADDVLIELAAEASAPAGKSAPAKKAAPRAKKPKN